MIRLGHPAAASSRRRRLPARTRAAGREPFGRISEELSTPETGPPADNLVTNEDSFPRVARDLAKQVPPGSAYLGVGPDQNLTCIAHARPGLAFILDHRRRNLLLHLVHKALLTIASDRATYLAKLTARSPIHPVTTDASAVDLIAAFGPASFDRARLDATIAEVAAALRPLGVVRDDEWPAVATIQAKLAGPGLDARFLALRMYPTLAQLIRTPTRDGKPAHFLAEESAVSLGPGPPARPTIERSPSSATSAGAVLAALAWEIGSGVAATPSACSISRTSSSSCSAPGDSPAMSRGSVGSPGPRVRS